MLKDTLSRIEAAIASIKSVEGERKAELIALLGRLKEEIAALPESRLDDARSIAHFTETAAHEVTRAGRSPERSNLSISGMAYSVKGFEASHPDLVKVVNEICMMLARIGI